jgi:hypothetical protein
MYILVYNSKKYKNFLNLQNKIMNLLLHPCPICLGVSVAAYIIYKKTNKKWK